MDVEIIFILGPAGVGKSCQSAELAKKLDYICYEIDQFPAADGIDAHGLRDEWDAFYGRAAPDALVDMLRERARAAGKAGVILSFPSMLILKGDHLRVLRGKVRIVYLTGTEQQCRDAFLAREQESRRRLGVEHWESHNKSMFQFLKTEEAKTYSVAAFEEGGSRRTVEHVLGDVATTGR